MSRQLKQDHKFTAAEVAYVKERNRYAEIEANRRLTFDEPEPQSQPEPPHPRVGHKRKAAP